MKSAKEFAEWLQQHFGPHQDGIYLTRDDIAELSGRQRYNQQFVSDVHFELTLLGMGFVTDAHREKFYLFHLPTRHWQDLGHDDIEILSSPK
ncbi:hypothetical protein [Oceanimonas baumannii]|uniref:Uncharacterized protein n=1 Tax=Oceanimonas baumannii TaxID=129578 RepID=A0A235CI56_9GAMM|nr:hypothetical protein [Oceanimonas baumannii]MCC4263345.1 hypothetical protein [Oceanimonas baumannii]OYD24220.1 hypothetical protein B6S09_09090 [Oceanimonas baumannii]TDW58946.1 hypothetical protein LY04_01767 [Oceanimonas baumannii]